MQGTIEIRTGRLVLRRHKESDAGILYELAGKNEEMYRWSGWNPYETPAMAEETVRRFIASYEDPSFFGWAIEYNVEMAGTIGAYDFDPSKGTIETGYSIFAPYQGHGFAAEALKAVLEYLISQEEITCVTAWCAAENIASEKTMKKAGMKLTETLKDDLKIGGNTYDRLIFEYTGK